MIYTDFYKGSEGAIVVYDVSSKESFDRVEFLRNNVLESIGEDIPIFLWGNRIDQTESRAISSEDGFSVAERLNVGFIETSAKEGTNVSELFTLLVSKIADKMISS